MEMQFYDSTNVKIFKIIFYESHFEYKEFLNKHRFIKLNILSQKNKRVCIDIYAYGVSIIKLEICEPSVAKSMQRNCKRIE